MSSSFRVKLRVHPAGTGFTPSSSAARDRWRVEPPSDWKSRLLPVEICREIDHFRNFNKTKGILEFTIPNFAAFAWVPPSVTEEELDEPPSPPAKKRRVVTRSLARRLEEEQRERDRETRRLAEKRQDQMEDRREAQLISPSCFIRGMAWRMDVRRTNEQLQVFLQCNGKGKWNWRTSARFLLESRTGPQSIVKHINKRIFHSHAHAWGFIPFAGIPALLDPANGYIGVDGSLRLKIDIDTSTGGFKTQEILRARIPDFPTFVSKPQSVRSNAVDVNGRPLRMLLNMNRLYGNGEMTAVGVGGVTPGHLTCFFQYNNGEPLYDGEQCTVDAVYEVVGGVGGGYKARQQSKFLFHGNALNAHNPPNNPREVAVVLQGKYDFAVAENLLNPENGYLGARNELDVVAYVFA